jgi:RHS repeat-associated protein
LSGLKGEPYKTRSESVSTLDPLPKFSGMERDAESGLDYFGARYYDKAQYRFISVDPVVDENMSIIDNRRWNLYAYCLNDPVTYIDLNGETSVIFDKATKKLAVVQGNGQLWDWFNASNNVGRGVSPWPQGHFTFWYWAPPENAGYYGWDFDPIDGFGAYIFKVPGRSGMSIHSGMVGVWDNAEHYDWECWTAGCIRTVVEVMEVFDYLESMGDKLTDLYVFNDFTMFCMSVGLAALTAISK